MIRSAEVIEFIIFISNHLECASMTMRNILFIKGPAKSTWILFHGSLGQFQLYNGAFAGFWPFDLRTHLIHQTQNYSGSECHQGFATDAFCWSGWVMTNLGGVDAASLGQVVVGHHSPPLWESHWFADLLHYEKHLVHKGSSEINMDPFPWLTRPVPIVQWCFCRIFTMFLTLLTQFYKFLDIGVHVRPPKPRPCWTLHFGCSQMCIMQCVKNIIL